MTTPSRRGRRRSDPPQTGPEPLPMVDRSRKRAVAGRVLTVLAGLLVWLVLLAPDRLDRLTLAAFLRLPIEGLVLAAVLLLLARARQLVAALAGVLLGVLAIVKVLDIGFFAALGRPFNPVIDRGYLDSAVGLLTDSIGRRDAVLSLAAAGVLVAAVLVGMPLAVLRLASMMNRHRAGSLRWVTALGVVWVLCAALGVQVGSGRPLASASAASLAWSQARQARAALRDERAFATAVAADRMSSTPADQLLAGLRGKDVLIAFVESYGRVAVQDSAFSPGVDAVLDAGTKSLAAAGFCSRSAFLTSPTFGGISWLAHATLQSGVWVDNQLRYDKLVASNRFTLSEAFKRAGWRTVSAIPSDTQDWPEGKSFYHYDMSYDARNVGYAGPKFSYASMPDQYTLAALQRNELAAVDRRPVMAEIDLVSSHTPWAPLPRLVDWNTIGDGSVFDTMPAEGRSPSVVWRDPAQVRAAYGQSIEYSLSSLISFVQTYPDDDLVLVVLGDHQPATIVSGSGAGRDVPISIIAHDPAVLRQISGWGWQNGLRPSPDAPVWRMDAFRDHFLASYGLRQAGAPTGSPAATQHGTCGP